MKKKFGLWLPVILWAAIIFLFSANPDPYRFLPAAWRSAVPLPTLSNSTAAELLGQLMHFLEYTVLAFLLARALYKTASTHINIYTVFIASLFAFSDEIHQLYVPGRAFQVIDLFIDFLGILLGLFLYTKLKLEPQRRKERHEEKNAKFFKEK